MVILLRRWLLILSFLPLLLNATTPIIVAEMLATQPTITGRLVGQITIYHSREQTIDPHSFVLEGQPLHVELLYTAKLSTEELRSYSQYTTDDVVTLYRFEIAGQPKGLYILPSIQVQINGSAIESIPSTYHISEEQAVPQLNLEAFVEPSEPIYPGQRLHFLYRITFSQPIELTVEQLPLLSAEGFEKIGGKEIRENETSLYTTQEIRQEVRASQAGSYLFGSSVVEGRIFRENIQGQRVYEGPLLHAESPPITIVVLPFPEEGRPLSFTGTLGEVTLDARLSGSSVISLGDEVTLSVRLSGSSDPDTLRLPTLACQPGFSGFFQFSDFPPSEHIDGNMKEFLVSLRPVSHSTQSIPPVEFSYFDPQQARYTTVRSTEIPIQVKPTRLTSIPSEETQTSFIDHGEWRAWLGRPAPTEIDTLLPDTAVSPEKPSDRQWVIWLAAGACLVALQWIGRQWGLCRRKKSQPITRLDHIRLANKYQNDPALFYHHLEQALEGKSDEPSRQLLLRLHASRYGRGLVEPPSVLLQEARRLLAE